MTEGTESKEPPSTGCGISGGLLMLAISAVIGGSIFFSIRGGSAASVAVLVVEVLSAFSFLLAAVWALGLHKMRPGSADTAVGLGAAGGWLLVVDAMLRDLFKTGFADWDVVFLAGFVIFTLISYWYAWDMSKGDGTSAFARFRSWRMAVAAANELGLWRRRFSLGVNATGQIGGVGVRIGADRRGVVVEAALDELPGDLVLEPEARRSLTRAVFPEQIVTGDDAFDARVFVRGGAAAILAALDAEARLELGDLVFDGASISGKRLRTTRREGAKGAARLRDHTDLVALARRLAAAAKLLARNQARIPAALLENVKRDPIAKVRAANLRCLRREYPGAPETADAIAAGLGDADEVVRIAAADPSKDAGRLSVATTDAGALSTPSAIGAVSLPKQKT